ncbi:MAG: nitroreductase family protein, partial [Bacillota bacterium]
VCKSETLSLIDGQVLINPNSPLGCIGCGQCMMVCPAGCLTVDGRDVSPLDLITIPTADTWATPEQLEALLLSRRSIREFEEREVSRELIDKIINIASTAPMGVPPSDVEILVFQGREKVQAFAEDMVQSFLKSKRIINRFTLHLMRPFIGKEAYEVFTSFVIPLFELIPQLRKEGIDWLLYDAPLAMLFHNSPYADPQDSVIAATYAMIAGQSLGMGSCMIGTICPVIKYDKKLKSKWGIPLKNQLGIVVIFGYPNIQYQKAIRRRFRRVNFA